MPWAICEGMVLRSEINFFDCAVTIILIKRDDSIFLCFSGLQMKSYCVKGCRVFHHRHSNSEIICQGRGVCAYWSLLLWFKESANTFCFCNLFKPQHRVTFCLFLCWVFPFHMDLIIFIVPKLNELNELALCCVVLMLNDYLEDWRCPVVSAFCVPFCFCF
jgi:hypothetical protein